MKVKDLLPIIKETKYEIEVERPAEIGLYGVHCTYGIENITPEIMEEDVCFIIPYEPLNRLVLCVSNGEIKNRSSVYLKFI